MKVEFKQLFKNNRALEVLFIIIVLTFLLVSCKPLYNSEYKKPDLVDQKLSRPTKKLHKKLFYITKSGFAIGHQDATSYGIGWTHDELSGQTNSDIKKLINDYPALYGFDIGHLELGKPSNLDSVPFHTMRELIIDAHKKGGLISISWHPDNPKTKGSSWDKTPAVADILKGGSLHNAYNLWIDRLATFIKSLKYKGKQIPIIFRPYHEMNGSWFWWGSPNCSPSEYITLWKETVTLLKDKHRLHNLLYVYSPNKLNSAEDFMAYYPGDEYVDMLGIDIYDFNDSEDYVKSLNHDLKLVKNIANEKKKLYGFTETGLETIQTPNWYTNVLYPAIKDSGISWILFWRNDSKKHHYIPYLGHKNANDFVEFASFPKTLFLKDIKDL